MIHISKTVEAGLKVLSVFTNELFKEENIKYFSSKTKKKFNNSNYDKLISQLPNGIYRKIEDVIDVIKLNTIEKNTNAVSYSPLYFPRQELNVCKRISYNVGNIITGREKEVEQILTCLGRKEKRNVILVGQAGTGKTAIVRHISSCLTEGNVPNFLKGCKIYNLDLPYIFANYKEDPLKPIINLLEVASTEDKNILFVDEIHQLLDHKLGNILKPYLTEKMRLIGATTLDEYNSIITSDEALERRFTVIYINEPSISETNRIVKNTKSKFEKHHNCIIPDDVCEYAVQTGSKFLGHRKNPDKSFDVLDVACSIAARKEIKEISTTTIFNNELEQLLNNDLSIIKNSQVCAGNRTITVDYIDEAISSISGIDYDVIKNSTNYDSIVSNINQEVINQKTQVEELCTVITKNKIISLERKSPISVMTLLGPGGCGKTYSVELLAENMLGNKDLIITYDLSGLNDKHQITEIKGAPPGYIGYSKASRLISELRMKPYSFLVFKGCSLCHESIIDYIIKSIRSAEFIDSADKRASIINTVVIFMITLNGEDEKLLNRKSMGFSKVATDEVDLKKLIPISIYDASETIITYNKLSKSDLSLLFDKEINKYNNEIKGIDITSIKETIITESNNAHDIINSVNNKLNKLIFNNIRRSNDQSKNDKL